MVFYWGLWLFFLIFSIIGTDKKFDVNRQYKILYFCLLIIAILVGGREYVGTDWLNYFYFYNVGVIETTGENGDFLFQLLRDVSQKMGFSYGFFLFIVSTISLTVLWKAFKIAEINNCWYAFLVYLSIAFCQFQLNVIRFGVLASFMLLAFTYKAKGEIVKGLLFLIIGAGFHKSGVFFLLLYPFIDKILSNRTLYLCIGLAIIIFFAGFIERLSSFIVPLAMSLGFDNYTDLNRWGGSVLSVGLLGKIMIWIYAFFFNKKLYESSCVFRSAVNLLFVVVVVSLALGQYAVFIERIGNAMSLALVLIIPMLINKTKRQKSILLGSVFVAYLFMYYPLVWNRDESNMLPFVTHIRNLF